MSFHLNSDAVKTAVLAAYPDEPRAAKAFDKWLIRRDSRLIREVISIYVLQLAKRDDEFTELLQELLEQVRKGEGMDSAPAVALHEGEDSEDEEEPRWGSD